jgi:hypothetical protein
VGSSSVNYVSGKKMIKPASEVLKIIKLKKNSKIKTHRQQGMHVIGWAIEDSMTR